MAIKLLSSLKIGALTFPATDGQSGQVLVTDGSGNVSFTNQGGVSGLSFSSGVLTASTASGNITVNLDGRYALSSHTHAYDNYQSWNLKTNGIQRTTVQSGGTLDLVAGSNVSLSYGAGGVVTISSTDTNTDTNYYVNAAGFNTSTGVLTLTRNDGGTVTVDLDGKYAEASHTHSYLPLSGGTLTGKIIFNTASTDNGFEWIVNSDSAGITFKNTGDGDTNSYFNLFTKDNGNEYFKFSHTHYQNGTKDFMDIKDGAVYVNGNIYANASQTGSAASGTNYLSGGNRVWHAGDFTSTNISNWNTAYGWGNHASVGYLTSFTETDPTVPSHVKSITTTEKANWNTAYGWGNHASAGYQAASTAITTSNIGSQSVSYATTAGSWNNARTITIGNTGKSVNGSANVSWTLAEIGAQAAGSYAAASHTHDDRYYTESESDGRFVRKNTWEGNAYIGTGGDFYGTIFYDSNDSGYYMDPASTSNLNGVNARYFVQSANGVPSNNLGSPTVTEMALFNEQFNNKTAFCDPSRVTVWRQRTSSDPWEDITSMYGSDAIRRFLGGYDSSSNIYIPNGSYKFRIEISAVSYVFLNALYMYWSSNSHSTKVHVWARRVSDSTWLQVTDSSTDIGAWPGHMYLPFSTIAYLPGPSTSTGHRDIVRFEFTPTWSTGAYSDRNIDLYKMQVWGGYPAGTRYPYYVNEYGDFTGLRDIYSSSGKLATETYVTTRGYITSSSSISGNAATATALQTARTLTIGNTGKTFDGSGNVSWSLAEIGAQAAGSYAASSHSHSDATTSASGFMSAADKTKLNGIASGATANTGTVTSVSGTGSVSGLTLSGTVTGSGSLTLGGTLALTSANVTSALGFTPYNSSNPNGYITSSGSISGSAGSVSGLTLTSSANGINPDNVTQNQIGYNTSVSLFGQTDGGLYSSAYSSSWIHQIYGDFRTGQIAIRGKNNGTWQAWRTVLDSSNYTSYAAAASHTHTPSQVGLGNVSNAAQVTTANNSSLNGDSRNTRGVTRLYRRDDNSDYSVQTYWTGSYWRLYGYNGDSGHADTHVGYADNAGYSSSTGSVAWTNVSGRPTAVSSFTNDSGYLTALPSHDHDDRYFTESESDGRYARISHEHDRTFLTDSRGAARLPSYYDDRYAQWDFQNTSDTGAGGDSWHGVLTVAKWSTYDPSHRQEQLIFTGDELKRRTATSDSAWGTIKTIIDSGNIGSQSVNYATTAGSAPANGGNSSTVGGLSVHSSRNNEANKIVRTDGNGYIQAGWINTPSGAFSSGITKIYCSDDDYVRYQTPANFISNLGLITTSNIGSQSVNYATSAGNADTVDGWHRDDIRAWDNITGRPGWLSGGSYVESHSNANDWRNSGFYENGGGGSNWPSQTWYNSINVRHSNQSNYHGFQIAMSYYDNNLWFRSYQGSGTFQSWEYAISNRTIGSQSVNYANSAGSVAWGNVSGRPTALSSFTNDLGNYGGWITSSGRAYPRRSDGGDLNFYWSGQSGQPTWLWGGTDGTNMYVYNPSNFSVNYAASAGSVAWGNVSGRPTTVSSFTNDSGYVTGGSSPTFTEVYANNWFRNNESNEGLYNQATTQHWSSQTNGYWDASSTTTVSSIRFYTGGHVRDLRGYVYANNSNEIGFLNSGGSWSLRCDNSGNVTATGDVTAYSDARIKTEVKTVENALDKVLALRGVTYKRTDTEDKSTKLGVIAQEVQQVLPEVVSENQDGMLTVSYGNMVGVLIEAMKEQQAIIETLEAKIELLTKFLK